MASGLGGTSATATLIAMEDVAGHAKSGAERYFARQHEDPEFRTAYARAKAEVNFIDAVRHRVELRRRELGLSEAELALRAGVPRRRVCQLLSAGNGGIGLDSVAAIAAAVGIELRVDPATDRAAGAVI